MMIFNHFNKLYTCYLRIWLKDIVQFFFLNFQNLILVSFLLSIVRCSVCLQCIQYDRLQKTLKVKYEN